MTISSRADKPHPTQRFHLELLNKKDVRLVALRPSPKRYVKL